MKKENNISLFNPEVKNEFFKSVTNNEGTIKYYSRIFYNTFVYEESLGKDINQFSIEELEKILYDFKANNRHTIESYGRIISSYLNWSMEQGLTDKNPLRKLSSDDFDKYITDKEEYITEKQLRRYEEKCANYQDAVIFRLLFEGLSGKQVSEIGNLKVSDCDFEKNSLHLINSLEVDENGYPSKFTERTIKVSDHAMELIRGAINQKQYIKKNGNMSTEASNVRDFTDLVQNDYVVRASITKNSEDINKPTDRFVIYKRIKLIGDDLGIKSFTAKLIQRSGMIYLASQLVQNDEDVTISDLKIIADRFNLNTYFNIKGFLTKDLINNMYPR
ncbi:site-specific integrase [Shimazuella kribbensis]|uniref:site-specific integrase n=1 Tax=Shimazuella kribbensis TaxID=139808 RepID=UPI000403B0E3|nr:site-specific integrase [Shimazuella kribbensis]